MGTSRLYTKRGETNKMLHFRAHRALILAIFFLAATLAACAAPEPAAPTPAPSLATPSPTPAPTEEPPVPVTVVRPEFTPGKRVAHIFGEGEDALLYCGFEAINTGDCPAVIETVYAEFDVEGAGRFSTDFSPVAGEYDVIQPGGKTFCALWLPAREGLPENPAVTLSLELSALPSDAGAIELAVKNARVIQNYPAFATVSGSLWNESGEECPLNVVYTAFYDQAGELLGVFHFTKNASMYADEFKNFVVHMQPLPIENLAENTVTIETHAFGIE